MSLAQPMPSDNDDLRALPEASGFFASCGSPMPSATSSAETVPPPGHEDQCTAGKPDGDVRGNSEREIQEVQRATIAEGSSSSVRCAPQKETTGFERGGHEQKRTDLEMETDGICSGPGKDLHQTLPESHAYGTLKLLDNQWSSSKRDVSKESNAAVAGNIDSAPQSCSNPTTENQCTSADVSVVEKKDPAPSEPGQSKQTSTDGDERVQRSSKRKRLATPVLSSGTVDDEQSGKTKKLRSQSAGIRKENGAGLGLESKVAAFSTSGRLWTTEDDHRLQKLVSRPSGDWTWKEIGEALGRSASSAESRFRRLCENEEDQERVRGWTRKEDRKLQSLVSKPAKEWSWKQVADALGRSVKTVQGRERRLREANAEKMKISATYKKSGASSSARATAFEKSPSCAKKSSRSTKVIPMRRKRDLEAPGATSSGEMAEAELEETPGAGISRANQDSGVAKSVAMLADVRARCSVKFDKNFTSLRRENLALRLALFQQAAQAESRGKRRLNEGHVSEGEERRLITTKTTIERGESVQGADRFDPVVQAAIRVKLATAWSLSSIPYLPEDMFVRQSQPSQPVSHNPQDWSFDILLSFLTDLVTHKEYPASHLEASKAIESVVSAGVTPLLEKMVATGHVFVSLSRVKTAVKELLTEALEKEDVNFRWIALLGSKLLAQVVAWSQRPSNQYAQLEMDELCSAILAQCSQALTTSKVITGRARALEMALAVYQANPAAVRKMLPPAREALFRHLPLLAMMNAMEL